MPEPITHNLTEAEKLCARVGVIRSGKLLAVGNPDDLRLGRGRHRIEIVGHGFSEHTLGLLRARPEIVRVETQNGRLLIDLRGESQAAPLVTLIVQSGGEVEEVGRAGTSLEDLFLTLMEEESR